MNTTIPTPSQLPHRTPAIKYINNNDAIATYRLCNYLRQQHLKRTPIEGLAAKLKITSNMFDYVTKFLTHVGATTINPERTMIKLEWYINPHKKHLPQHTRVIHTWQSPAWLNTASKTARSPTMKASCVINTGKNTASDQSHKLQNTKFNARQKNGKRMD